MFGKVSTLRVCSNVVQLQLYMCSLHQGLLVEFQHQNPQLWCKHCPIHEHRLFTHAAQNHRNTFHRPCIFKFVHLTAPRVEFDALSKIFCFDQQQQVGVLVSRCHSPNNWAHNLNHTSLFFYMDQIKYAPHVNTLMLIETHSLLAGIILCNQPAVDKPVAVCGSMSMSVTAWLCLHLSDWNLSVQIPVLAILPLLYRHVSMSTYWTPLIWTPCMQYTPILPLHFGTSDGHSKNWRPVSYWNNCCWHTLQFQNSRIHCVVKIIYAVTKTLQHKSFQTKW